MKRKRIGIILAVLGAIVSIGTGYYVYTTAQEAEALAKQTPKVQVVVALADLPERAPITQAAVSTALVPEHVVPANAATDVSDVVGKYPLVAIYRNEVVNTSKLAESEATSGPSFTLKPGMVAVTFPGSDLLTPTGAVRTGDRVDILLTLSLAKAVPTQPGGQAAMTLPPTSAVSQTLLQNVEVLRIGAFPTGAGEASAGKGVTFQVSHQDALILKWAKDSGGQIDLVLRHPSDREPVDTEAITPNYIFKKFKFALSEPLQP